MVIFWLYRNIEKTFTAYQMENTVFSVIEGYHTFPDIKDSFAENNIDVQQITMNGKCKITNNNTSDLTLKKNSPIS